MTFVTPEERLRQGATILESKLQPFGFAFGIVDSGKGSGGDFAIGAFTAGDREIRMWFRFHLGDVTYRKGSVEAPHKAVAQYLGLEGTTAYPCPQTDNPLEGFEALLTDWHHWNLFFQNEGALFESVMQAYKYKQPPAGFTTIFRHEKK
ncbi:hypothetical protein [Solimonas aquatica]|uniref:hypothetical protein n=1 Tax=Solimonas aquatica TaxID=489703 RepID=UPI0011601503|nr:hypothetical protein [Solimonas aquatica]